MLFSHGSHMDVVILAAGYATRLYPLTRNLPKGLLKIAGKPVVEYTLDDLIECAGCRRQVDSESLGNIYLVTNCRFYGMFQQWLTRYKQKLKGKSIPSIEIVNDRTTSNADRLGSVGDLWFTVQQKRITGDVMVLCSDRMYEFRLFRFIAFFRTKNAAVNACQDLMDTEKIRGKYGCVVTDAQDRIVEFQEKPERPKSTISSIAFYIYPARSIPLMEEFLESTAEHDAPGGFASWYCQREEMYAYLVEGECHDIGTRESYYRVNRLYRNRLTR